MRITRKVKYRIGDEVALRVDPLTRRIITGYTIRSKQMTYIVSSLDGETWHQEVEIDKCLTRGKKAGFVN